MSTRGIKLHTTYGPCYVRDFFVVCFRSYFFVHASLKLSIGKGRPDTVVEVWAQSEQCGARGRALQVLSAGVRKTISGGSVRGLIHFHTYVPIRFFFVFFCSSTAHTTDSNSSIQRACLPPPDYKPTTLPPQHYERIASPRCTIACFIGACDRSPDHTNSAAAACCV